MKDSVVRIFLSMHEKNVVSCVQKIAHASDYNSIIATQTSRLSNYSRAGKRETKIELSRFQKLDRPSENLLMAPLRTYLYEEKAVEVTNGWDEPIYYVPSFMDGVK